jgi:hypothetical protein
MLLAWLLAAMALAVDGCSTPDCTETETCPVVSDATADDEPTAVGDGTTEASNDAGDGGDGAEDASPIDANPPTGPSDGPELADSADGTDGAGNDVDASDGSMLPDAPEGSTDGGLRDAAAPCNDAAPENCIDGLDNDCNGKIDCADQPACSAYGCAPPPPSSWLGPAVLWTGAGTATLPACPAGYPTAVDGFSGLTFANDTCTCQCTATGQTCSGGTAMIYASLNCGSACATVALTSGTCVTFSSCSGEQGAWQVTAPVSATGQCTAVTTPTSGGPPTWKTAVRVCTSTGTTNRAGGCSTATDECLPIAASPFGAALCVYQTGTQTTCPAPYNHNAKPFVYSTGSTTDGRGCSACTCGGTPTAGTCSGGVHLYGAPNCTGTAVASGSGCQTFNDPFGGSAEAVEASYSSTPGTCPAPSTMTQPTGAVTATGAFSVCCM